MINRIDVRQLEQKLINTEVKPNKNIQSSQIKDFGKILESVKNQDEIKFSKHAKARLDSRNIRLNDQDMDEIREAFNKAEDKGVKDALILMEKQAFIASIDNKTIITAVGRENLDDNVFTNIDGAVII